MTTWKVREDQDLADALTAAIGHASPDAVVALTELRNAATVGNGCQIAHVPWDAREPVARALRSLAGTGHAQGVELRNLADGLEEALAWRLVQHGGPVPAPKPAPVPEPAAEAQPEPVPEHVGGY